jgi:hypothetical protein
MQRTNNLLRKSPTWSVVDGPPMFMKTIAVGPFEPITPRDTGGTTVAKVRCRPTSSGTSEAEDHGAGLERRINGWRRAIVSYYENPDTRIRMAYRVYRIRSVERYVCTCTA